MVAFVSNGETKDNAGGVESSGIFSTPCIVIVAPIAGRSGVENGVIVTFFVQASKMCTLPRLYPCNILT
jgi:hypothetical protein